MVNRRPADRCLRCAMRTAQCLCALIPRLEIATRLVVIMHWREANTTTNTGRIAALAIPGSEVRLRGVAGERDIADGTATASRRTLVLFPTENAVALDADFVARYPGPYTLVVPDGSWRQARKVAKREGALADALRVRIAEPGVSQYRLRRSPREGALSTIEAIARALGVLEGPAVERELEALFQVMVGRILAGRSAFSKRPAFDHFSPG